MQKGKYNKINVLFIICFLLLIAIPVIESDKIGGKISNVENRYLAKFPSIVDENNNLNLTNFTNNFENYINDNIGFREQASKVNTILHWYVFKMSARPDTMIGEDKWLFYYTPDIIKDFQKKNIPTLNDLQKYYKSFKSLENYCNSAGAKNFYLMYLPDKKTIYPDKYNKYIIQNDGPSRSDIIIDYMKKHNINIIAPFSELIEAKKNAIVYSPRLDNAHWNSYGSFIGYKTLMDKIYKDYPNIKNNNNFLYNISSSISRGLFNGVIPISELSYVFEKNHKNHMVSSDLSWYDSLSMYNSSIKYRYINENSYLPKVLIIGDSYCGAGLVNFMAEYFSEITFIPNIIDMGILKEAMKSLEPNIVVYEIVERMFSAGENTLNYLSSTGYYKD